MVRELKALEVTDSIPSPSTVVEQQLPKTSKCSADNVTARAVCYEYPFQRKETRRGMATIPAKKGLIRFYYRFCN